MSEEINKLSEVESGAQREAEKEAAFIRSPDYTAEEQHYLGQLRNRLERARQERDQALEFFDGMTYEQRCQHNRRLANSYTKPKENRQDINFTTGTTRQKLLTGLASLNDLNLAPDITAFNENSVAQSRAGEAFEDIIEEQKYNDGDDEKKLIRHYTMIEQGEVFFEVGVSNDKKLKKTMTNYKEGKFRNVKINSRYDKALKHLTTNIIRNEKVFLGDITTFGMENQPYIFTVEHKPYAEIEAAFGDWEMWEYVSYSQRYFDDTTMDTEYPFWRITSPREGFCEIVRYQSKPENEAQIFINGIPMLPIGYPLEEISPDGKYTIDMQVYELIDAHFAYGKSQMQRLKNVQGLEDSFWRTSIFKAQQQAKPPLINNTGKMLSESVFMPASMVHNVPEGKLFPLLGDAAGISSSEAKIMEMLRNNLNSNSSEPQISGQQPEGGTPTATQVQTVQEMAEKMIGLTVFAASLMEKKVVNKMIPLILSHFLEPVSDRVAPVSQYLNSKYRNFTVEKQIDGKGMGQEIVEIVDKDTIPSPIQVLKDEKAIEKKTGLPTRKITINRDAISAHSWTWRVNVVPKPKRSTNLEKAMFQEKVQIYSQSPNFNMDWFEENAALTWGDNPRKVFRRNNRSRQQTPPEAGAQQGEQQSTAATAVKQTAQNQTSKPTGGAQNANRTNQGENA
jgi:hypothetical protein